MVDTLEVAGRDRGGDDQRGGHRDRQRRQACAGGLLDARRIPDIQDSDLAGWQRALAALRALRVSTVVPGHGPATSSDAVIAAQEAYQRHLDSVEKGGNTWFFEEPRNMMRARRKAMRRDGMEQPRA